MAIALMRTRTYLRTTYWHSYGMIKLTTRLRNYVSNSLMISYANVIDPSFPPLSHPLSCVLFGGLIGGQTF